MTYLLVKMEQNRTRGNKLEEAGTFEKQLVD